MGELDKLVEAVLDGEDLEVLHRLSDVDKEIAWKILLELQKTGDYNRLQDAWMMKIILG